MMFKKILLSLCCFISIVQLVPAQPNINFTYLTTKDGLSSNTVNAILKDHVGLMWFATEDGLNKFDGTNFTAYRHIPNDSTSLVTNEILSLYEDKLGNLWVGTGGGSLSMYDYNRNAFVSFNLQDGSTKPGGEAITSICGDHLGNVWVSHYGGINIIEPKSKTVKAFYMEKDLPFRTGTLCMFEDSNHNMWIGTNEGLFVYNTIQKTYKHFRHSATDSTSIPDDRIHTITEDKNKHIWIGTSEGLCMLQPGGDKFITYQLSNSAAALSGENNINTLVINDDNHLWIGTSNGFNILNINKNEITYLKSDFRNVHSISYNGILCCYIDKQGIYWIGTFRGGINKYDENLNLFNLVQGSPYDEDGLHAKIVNSFVENSNGELYVGTEDGGVSLFNPTTNTVRNLKIQLQPGVPGKQFSVGGLGITKSNQLMIGTYQEGLIVMDPLSGKYKQLLKGNTASDLNSNKITRCLEDHLGQRWIGTNGMGINVLDETNKVKFRLVPNPVLPNDIQLPANGFIRDILEDRNSNLWIATMGSGIACYTPGTKQFTVYNTVNSKLPSAKVQSLLEDHDGNIWIGTLGGGLCLLDKKTGQFQVFSEENGLQNNNIRKVVEDKQGRIWVSCDKGISSIEPTTYKINNYNYHNGVQHNNFIGGAGLCSSNGTLYFGGLEGFNYFNPQYLKKNKNVPKVLITDLKVANQSVSPSAEGPIQENIATTKEIHLDYKQNFTLSFVGLNYTAPEQNQYAYKLEGFDKDWNYVGSTTSASYTNLDPGEYTFKVIASNNDGIWNKEGTSIKIFVQPPFWRTTYAYLFYLLVFAAILLYSRHRGIRRIEQKFIQEQRKTATEQEQKERERVHEMDQQKIKFLTNLSHEFRTPISLILGPVENLISQGNSERQTGQLQLIKRNGKRLLNLVNQLLDFRKMEEHELKLQPSEGEFISFAKEASDAFKDLAEKRKITFEFTSSLEKLYTRFDHDKVERILFNLLSNAFKFTLKGGIITLKLDKNKSLSNEKTTWVSISIQDTGIGIPADQVEKIFERFFQHTTVGAVLNQGTGIGLSITKEFVEMQGGTIEVASELEKGTLFTVQLPLEPLPDPVDDEVIQPLQTPFFNAIDAEPEFAEALKPISKADKTELSSILLIEDDEDFRFYLKDNLQQQYKIYEAANGKEGWQKALAHHPHLIVSDINMPYMDGIELCKKIKADKRTNHIPVILLTALTAEQDQLKGLETGANDYITKPFNFDLLNAKVKNLLVLNKTLKSTYTKQIKVLAPETKVESEDEKLMERIMNYIEENLTDSQLSVEELSRNIGMSRSSLYNKLLELTGQTPVDFIRSVKLDKAAVLLEKSDLNIAQIAYSVGFSTPNYFTKSFKTKFNLLPSEYIQQIRNKNSGLKDTNAV